MKPLSSENGVLDFRGDVFQGLEVFYVKADYALLKAKNTSRIGGFWGVGCTVDGEAGILDGGLPYYSYGGVFYLTPILWLSVQKLGSGRLF